MKVTIIGFPCGTNKITIYRQVTVGQHEIELLQALAIGAKVTFSLWPNHKSTLLPGFIRVETTIVGMLIGVTQTGPMPNNTSASWKYLPVCHDLTLEICAGGNATVTMIPESGKEGAETIIGSHGIDGEKAFEFLKQHNWKW